MCLLDIEVLSAERPTGLLREGKGVRAERAFSATCWNARRIIRGSGAMNRPPWASSRLESRI